MPLLLRGALPAFAFRRTVELRTLSCVCCADIDVMSASSPKTLQYASRLLAVHPLCPMAVQHRHSWTLQNYKTSQSWYHSAGAEYRTATCSLCDTPVQLLVFDVVRRLAAGLHDLCVSSLLIMHKSCLLALQSKVPQEQLNSVELAVLRTVGIQHPHLHLPWAAFEDAGFLCILYPPIAKV